MSNLSSEGIILSLNQAKSWLKRVAGRDLQAIKCYLQIEIYAIYEAITFHTHDEGDNMKRALMLMMLPIVFSSFSLAQSNKSVDFNPTPIYKQGRFIGGLAPELEKISAINEDTSGVNVVYPMKIVVKRATGDTNGKMLIFRAPTWRVAMRKIVGRDPEFEKILNSTVGHLVDMDAPFPDLELIFEYHNSINNASDRDPNPITPKGKSHFVQVMQKKLPPGKHNLRLGACIKRSDTLLNSVMDGWWWLSLVENIFNKSILGISFKAFLGYVKLRATCSATKY
ncbi:MAG: hypothetical protein GYA55_14100, partial [SAR324 cluster bacterium]|nr:hypothetical protein [SAR324 cluster bacterium]